MVQLIITIMAIGLTVLLAIAFVTYAPWWYKTANDTDTVVRASLTTLERAYDVATRAANGTPPLVTAEPDGGLHTNFGSLMFAPASPPGFMWVYGKHAADGSRYSNMDYFCLTPTQGSTGATEGVVRGVERVRNVFSAEQVIVSNACGANSSWATPTTYPANLHLTMYVTYVPGVSE